MEKIVYKKFKKNVIDVFSLIKKKSKKKFIESIDVDINLYLKKKNINTNICGNVLLPKNIGKKKKIIVFTSNKNFNDAYKFGAFLVGNEDLIDKILNKKIKYDIIISTFDVIKIVNKLSSFLVSRNMMPSLKFGTVTNDLKKTILEFKERKIIFLVDKYGIIHNSIGTLKISDNDLFDNFFCLYSKIDSLKNKNSFLIKKITLSSTMGKGYVVYKND